MRVNWPQRNLKRNLAGGSGSIYGNADSYLLGAYTSLGERLLEDALVEIKCDRSEPMEFCVKSMGKRTCHLCRLRALAWLHQDGDQYADCLGVSDHAWDLLLEGADDLVLTRIQEEFGQVGLTIARILMRRGWIRSHEIRDLAPALSCEAYRFLQEIRCPKALMMGDMFYALDLEMETYAKEEQIGRRQRRRHNRQSQRGTARRDLRRGNTPVEKRELAYAGELG